MKYARLVFFAGLFLVVARATSANAQILSPSRLSIASPDSTIDKLTKRIEALESIVAQLQQKVAFIKSVSPLVLDASTDAVTIRGSQISFEATGSLTMRAGTALGIMAGSDLNLRSFSNTSMRAGNQMSVEAASALDLKGSSIRHNGVTMQGPTP